MSAPDYFEKHFWQNGYERIAGVDEAGRGPLAGPVVAAAVILPLNFVDHYGIDDSKKLTARDREHLFTIITKEAVAYAVAEISHLQIDSINIYNASLLAMFEAVNKLSPQPDFVLFDGRACPLVSLPCSAIVKGDSLSVSIAAASIIAKVTRDRIMIEYDKQYPQYDFYNNKGYGTRAHINALMENGHSPIHRLSFKVRKLNI